MDNDISKKLARSLVLCNYERAFIIAHPFYFNGYDWVKDKSLYVYTNLWTGEKGHEKGM